MREKKDERKKSYFHVFFLNFIVMLIVPLLTIMLIFWEANHIVKNQILSSASNSLERYSELFDVTIKDMSSTCLSIFGRAECRDYCVYSTEDSTKKYIQSYKINDMLEGMNSDKYYDIFVYFPYDDKVISASKATLTSWHYYNVYYDNGGGEEGLQEFTEVINCDAKQPTMYVIGSQGEERYLCVAMNASGVLKQDYTICIVLKPEYVEEIYSMGDTDEMSSFLIFNGEEKLLIGSNVEMHGREIWQGLSLQSLESGVWHDKEDCMIQVRGSGSLLGFYAYSVSEDSFWSVLFELRTFCVLGIVFCIFVSVVIAYRNTVRTYKPVGNLVSRLATTNDLKFDRSQGNEFDFVTRFLDENDKKMRESRSVHREWYLLQLLQGKTGAQKEDIVGNGILSFTSNCFLVGVLNVDSSQEDGDDLRSFIIQNVFEELGDKHGKGYVVPFAKNEYALLLNITGEIDELEKDLQYGQRFCEQYFHIFMTVGYSNVHEGLQNIPKCHREAQEAIRYQYLYGQGALIPYAQIADRKSQYRAEAESKTYMTLLEYIRNDHKEKSDAQFVEEFLRMHNISEEASMDGIELFKHEVADALNKVIAKCCEDQEGYNEMVVELLEQPTLISFRTYLSRLIQQIQNEEGPAENEELLVRTKTYIEENYWNTDLSVAMLGELMGVRGKYLSKIFKEKYHVSLPDYLLYVRIQRAKEFLKEKEMTIQEIAEETGFLSSHVFIRNFKNREGITPGKYRELAKKADMA